MNVRLPSVRDPRSFYDIFSVAAVSIGIVALVLTVWHGTIVRFEMAVFVGIVFLWAGWAVNKALERSVEERTQSSNRSK